MSSQGTNPYMKYAMYIVLNAGVVYMVRAISIWMLCPASAITTTGVDPTLCLEISKNLLNQMILLLRTNPVAVGLFTSATTIFIDKGIRRFGKNHRVARLTVK